MTDNDIIKALGICGITNKCTECPYYNEVDCCEKNANDVIDLIKRQKEEIERLEQELAEMKRIEKMRIEGKELWWEREISAREDG